jgi:hypothetical protein
MTDLKFHPLAGIFPLMEGAEFGALVADIKANGLHYPVILYDGKILDGRNRYRACLAAGFEPAVRNGDNWIGDPASFVISRNIHRRHLTAKQRRELIAKLLKAAPEKSNRQIAETAKADDKTVATVRHDLEATAEIPQFEKTVGADGKARKQPANHGWSHERSKQHRAKRNRLASERERKQREKQRREDYFEETEAEAKGLAAKLVDLALAREVYELLSIGGELQLMDALRDALDPEGTGLDDPGASADAMKAKFAEANAAPVDDPTDPGPIPECLRRGVP